MTHIKSLLNQINTMDDFKIEPSDPIVLMADMNVFLSAGPKADDIEESPDRVLSFDAFATGLGDSLSVDMYL